MEEKHLEGGSLEGRQLEEEMIEGMRGCLRPVLSDMMRGERQVVLMRSILLYTTENSPQSHDLSHMIG